MKKISRRSFLTAMAAECSGCSYRLWCFLLHGKLRGILCGSIQRSYHFLGSGAGVGDYQGVQRCKGVSGRGSAL